MRHALGWYHSLIVTALYEVPGSDFSRHQDAFYHALKYCVASHPVLSAAVIDGDTESPAYARPATMDLRNHVQFLPQQAGIACGTAAEQVKQFLRDAHDQLVPYQDAIPPWKLVILPATDDP